jgi:rRNA-processing protein FCF1
VIAAVAETYRVKAEYDTAKRKRADNADALATALQVARKSERDAERALREHLEQHGCQAA